MITKEKIISSNNLNNGYIDYNLVNKTLKICKLLCLIIIIISSINILNNLNILPISTNPIFNIIHHPMFYIFTCLIILIISSGFKKQSKYLTRIFLVITGLCLGLIFLQNLNLINPENIILMNSKSYLELINLSYCFFLLILTVTKKYIKLGQIISLINLILGYGGFLIFISEPSINSILSLYFLIYHMLLSIIFLIIYPTEGLTREIHLITKGSKLTRYLITLIPSFLILFSIIIIGLNTIIPNLLERNAIISTGLIGFIIFTILIYAKKINESDIKTSETLKRIKKTTKFYDETLEYMVDGVAITDKEDNIIYVNKSLASYFEEDKNKIIGKNYLNSENLNLCKNEYIKAKESLKPQFIEVSEQKEKKKDIHLSGWITPRVKSNKSIGAIITVIDTSETEKKESSLKSSINEKNILISELHDRVKNNMQIIISLLHLESFNIEDKKTKLILNNSERRIKTIATIQEHSYQKIDKYININEYIHLLIENLKNEFNLNNIEFEIDTIKTSFNLDISIPLGLIINEILFTRLKFAFPNNKKGNIIIKLSKKNNEYILLTKDNGLGIEEKNSEYEGIGIDLIKILVEQIEGNYRFDGINGNTSLITFRYKKRTS